MSNKRPRTERQHRSPTETLANVTDELMASFNVPAIAGNIPQRLQDDLTARVEALLFALREAKQRQHVRALEIRLVRDTMQAVLAANELELKDAEVWYAEFRRLVEELGFQRTEVGFTKPPPKPGEP
jgi:hypothetical protein